MSKEKWTNYILVVVMNDGFDISWPNANQTIRLGYIHGFRRIGVASCLAHRDALPRLANEVENPIFWLTYDDYHFLSEEQRAAIKRHRHIIMVNTWFDGMLEVHRSVGAPSPEIPKHIIDRILDSEASFLWCSAPYFTAYEKWIETGQKMVSLPWACDVTRYYPVEGSHKFAGTEIAFVGGYRAYKESQYQSYLWPWEDKVKVWGYSEWPKCYQGHLHVEDEKILYRNAVLSPTISEPQNDVTGDVVERPFKIMGSGGLTILDCVPAYRCLFEPDEALMPSSVEEYREMANAVLADPGLNLKYRRAGFKAVQDRHTYAHRALKIMQELGL